MLKEVGDRRGMGEREERWDKGMEKEGVREWRKGLVGKGKKGWSKGGRKERIAG